MPHFPQLTTGSIAQYPVRRGHRMHTIVNEMPGGEQVRLGDFDAEAVEWELRLAGLTDDELAAIENLFAECEGRLAAFTFLDPSDNLLTWSESLTETVWQKGPLVDLTESLEDPFGTLRATRINNTSQSAEKVEQFLPVPASFTYAFSVYARSSQPTVVTLEVGGSQVSVRESFALGTQWRRCVSSVSPGGAGETVSFGVEVPSLASVEVFGLQVDAAPGASEYKKTASRGGVYAKARFAEDSLAITTDGPQRHNLVARVISREL